MVARDKMKVLNFPLNKQQRHLPSLTVLAIQPVLSAVVSVKKSRC